MTLLSLLPSVHPSLPCSYAATTNNSIDFFFLFFFVVIPSVSHSSQQVVLDKISRATLLLLNWDTTRRSRQRVWMSGWVVSCKAKSVWRVIAKNVCLSGSKCATLSSFKCVLIRSACQKVTFSDTSCQNTLFLFIIMIMMIIMLLVCL